MFPKRYLPDSLSRKDKEKQKRALLRARREYTHKHYIPRPHLASFHSKPSSHVKTARRMYKIEKITPSKELAKKTGCSRKALQKIVNKGEGAYYSSGSRPNQTAHSWGYARLASAITGANASRIDYSILKEGCHPNSRALRIAQIPSSLK